MSILSRISPALLLSCLLAFQVHAADEYIYCEGDSLMIDMSRQVGIGKLFSCNFKFGEKKELPEMLSASADSYMLERMGQEHRKEFSLRFWGSFNVYDNENQKIIAAACCCDTLERYALFYQYEPFKGFNYTILLIFDKQGIVISQTAAPAVKDVAQLKPEISPCKAFEIAKADAVYTGPMYGISLNYIDSLGGFCWIIEKDVSTNPKEHEFGVLYINANSGKVVLRDVEKFRHRSLQNK
jgi:hypothetical protein